MLLYIKNCRPDLYGNEPDKMSALTNLLTSHGLRNNIVTAPRDILKKIVTSNIYSSNDKMYANDILDSNREHVLLKKSLQFYGVVDFELTASTAVNMEGEQYIITVSYDHFVNPINAEATPVITENETDYTFYKVLGEYYSRHLSRLNLKIKLDHQLGAGSHSKTQFDRLSQRHPFVLCIVDNDKAHPSKGEGSTSRVFAPRDRQHNNGKLAKVISVREVESLIPQVILNQVFERASAGIIDTLDEIKNLAERHEDFRVYFDHKEGINLKQAITLDRSHGDFWLPILGDIARFSSKECFRTKICTDCDHCPKINGLGSNLLSSSNNIISQTNIRHFKGSREQYLHDHWKDIGELILTWGCTPNTRSART